MSVMGCMNDHVLAVLQFVKPHRMVNLFPVRLNDHVLEMRRCQHVKLLGFLRVLFVAAAARSSSAPCDGERRESQTNRCLKTRDSP